MADQQQPLKAPFPPPPPFYKSFTKANVAQLRKIRKASHVAEDTSEPKQDLDVLSLPPELRYLISPSASETWTSFGNSLTLNPTPTSLEEAGIEQLYPTNASNPQPHLNALARSLLTTFLSLVGTLSKNPTLYAGSVEDLQTLCYNMHDLINQYRPHQARESLIRMMEDRVARLKEEIARIEEGGQKVQGLMGRLAESGSAGGEVASGVEEEKGGKLKHESDGGKVAERQRRGWAAIEQELSAAAAGE